MPGLSGDLNMNAGKKSAQLQQNDIKELQIPPTCDPQFEAMAKLSRFGIFSTRPFSSSPASEGGA